MGKGAEREISKGSQWAVQGGWAVDQGVPGAMGEGCGSRRCQGGSVAGFRESKEPGPLGVCDPCNQAEQEVAPLGRGEGLEPEGTVIRGDVHGRHCRCQKSAAGVQPSRRAAWCGDKCRTVELGSRSLLYQLLVM